MLAQCLILFSQGNAWRERLSRHRGSSSKVAAGGKRRRRVFGDGHISAPAKWPRKGRRWLRHSHTPVSLSSASHKLIGQALARPKPGTTHHVSGCQAFRNTRPKGALGTLLRTLCRYRPVGSWNVLRKRRLQHTKVCTESQIRPGKRPHDTYCRTSPRSQAGTTCPS